MLFEVRLCNYAYRVQNLLFTRHNLVEVFSFNQKIFGVLITKKMCSCCYIQNTCGNIPCTTKLLNSNTIMQGSGRYITDLEVLRWYVFILLLNSFYSFTKITCKWDLIHFEILAFCINRADVIIVRLYQ